VKVRDITRHKIIQWIRSAYEEEGKTLRSLRLPRRSRGASFVGIGIVSACRKKEERERSIEGGGEPNHLRFVGANELQPIHLKEPLSQTPRRGQGGGRKKFIRVFYERSSTGITVY